MSTVVHRIRQFAHSLRAQVYPHERAALPEYLNAAQRALFEQMAAADQRHSLDLFYALREAGETDESLLQAALLHDVGKAGARLRLRHRVAYVLLGRLSRGWRDRLCAHPRRDWRYPLYVLAHHADLGAARAQQAGCTAEVVDLIRRHQQPAGANLRPPLQRKLRALQRVDGGRKTADGE